MMDNITWQLLHSQIIIFCLVIQNWDRQSIIEMLTLTGLVKPWCKTLYQIEYSNASK